MFIRKKHNKSGSVSIQIIDKCHGYKVKTVGSSCDKNEIERLMHRAQQILHSETPGQGWLFSADSREELIVESFVEQLSNTQIHTIGPELIFGKIFDRIGFCEISDTLFRDLTIARLSFGGSKLKTIDYLRRYKCIDIAKDRIYRFMDKLNNRYKEQVSLIAYRYTKNRLGKIVFLFYDMTTLYFEAEDEDDFRKIGFSKDGKFQNPQILLGLLVGQEGLPIGYDIFDGNTFEGHTLLPVLKKIEAAYGLEKPVVVADAGLLSNDNIINLSKEGYQFIIGARIKNESDNIKAEILNKASGMTDGDNFVLNKGNKTRLVITYSEKRAKKDFSNRERGVKKLRKQIQSGHLTKESINNRGYNKFLNISGEATVNIDEEKVLSDKQWDGLKGYITNTHLSAKDVADNYTQLWHIEQAFRISKSDLQVRPIYHYLKRRIEAHICIAFAAYTIYKELEHVLRQAKLSMSAKRAAELTRNMYEIEYIVQGTSAIKKKILKMDTEQQLLCDAVCKP